ncbi:murein hydrolase activator EnvC family protein [Phocaeicola oris]|uniref:murein hydrolase activator EnvC family protein n=1 Tax=Phocaeicola oris TaxID=2896850 RepID=UPI00234FB43D|nr:peptidoglycan DD-metalloendopeptidase family protein [Phocaeicola oris]MCE2617314.1 peptidoglycan DD-metalloendopeptidase family protein [Phocaeicola oris]
MKQILLLLLICFPFTLWAQTTPKIKELENRRKELSQQIAESETLLKSTKKDVKSQLDNLALITGQIDERKRYVDAIQNDVNSLNSEITQLELELADLQKELDDKKEKYAASVQYMYKNRSVQEKLMFILSAKNFNQMYRRMRYVREYADFQRVQGKEIEGKQLQVAQKKEELEATRGAKEALLKQGQTERIKLEIQERDRQTLIANLKKKQKGIQQELTKKRRTASQLNKEIDRLIAIEVEKARKRAEEEARRLAEAKKKAAEEAAAAKSKEDPAAIKSSENAARKASPRATIKSAPIEKYNLNTEDRRLSGNFERNKGILPVPITGPYLIISHFGTYSVDGLKYVKLDNKGIDIKGKQGAQARAIFDGEVSYVFKLNGLNNVLVRHGAYISVYCNLKNVMVSKGQHVNTRGLLGTVATDSNGNTVLHFQLRKETSKLNPEAWIGR